MKTNTFECVQISGYRGRWSEFDSYIVHDGTEYVILEHDTYGDNTCFIVCRRDDDDLVFVCETYDDIMTALKECEVI